MAVVAITLPGGGGRQNPADNLGNVSVGMKAPAPLRILELHGSVVRMGSLGSRGQSEPLYGVRLRAYVCSRSHAEANRTYPTSFRIAHYVPSTRTQARWGHPFRIVENDLHWLVPLGETRDVCGGVEFEDVIPPSNYGGLESPLGPPKHCYGVQLRIKASLAAASGATATTVYASRRTIIQCGSFRPS